MIGYHVTTPKKVARYKATGQILPPVRYWPNELTARRWAKKTGRTLIVTFTVPETNHPLPDHRPARFTPCGVREWSMFSLTPK